jgi:peptidoglycan/xylan/chitin deacetylase (PgdA/CDA1 family)
MRSSPITRRRFLATAAVTAVGTPVLANAAPAKAQIALTLDLEMSRHYPRRGLTEWDYQKGNLDNATKAYSLKAARVAHDLGARIHFFCVGRVLEQPDVGWLKEIIEMGHPVGNHTYDHVNVHAASPAQTQFRFQRAPWLIRGRTVSQIIEQNIATTNLAMKTRLGISPNGFRTPGGFYTGLKGREDLQRLMMKQGFKWVSSVYPRHLSGKPKQEPGPEVYNSIVAAQQKAQPFKYPTGLIEIPMSPISDVTAFRTNYWKLDYFLKAVRLAVEWAIQERKVFDFLAHPSCLVVEDPDCETIRMVCERVKQQKDRAEIVGLDRIASRVA